MAFNSENNTYFFGSYPSKYTNKQKEKKLWIYSNWYKIDHENNGITFNCVEQDMMYHKAILFGDITIANEILKETNPFNIKKYGRRVRNWNYSKWNKYKFNIVYNACVAKFTQNIELMAILLESDGIIAEASPYDKVWGIGFNIDDADNNKSNWGENLLGKILMKIRDEYEIHEYSVSTDEE